MDVFEGGNFYGQLHPGQINSDYSNFLGLGDPAKRAAKKEQKALEKLEKAKTANPKRAATLTKNANRKLSKAQTLYQKAGGLSNIAPLVPLAPLEDFTVSDSPPLQQDQLAGPTPTEQYTNPDDRAPVNTSKVLIYGGIGLATLFMLGVLLSRKGEIKMAKD